MPLLGELRALIGQVSGQKLQIDAPLRAPRYGDHRVESAWGIGRNQQGIGVLERAGAAQRRTLAAARSDIGIELSDLGALLIDLGALVAEARFGTSQLHLHRR